MAFRDILRGICDLILNNKLITFLSVALFAFVIATIALAGENNSNADALATCQHSLWQATSVAPPATTTVGGETTPTTLETSSPTPEASTSEALTSEVTTEESSVSPPASNLKFLTHDDYREQIRRR